MKSAVPKVLHTAGGLPLIEHVLRAADAPPPRSHRRRRRPRSRPGAGAPRGRLAQRTLGRCSGAAARDRARAAPGRSPAERSGRARSSCSRATCRCSAPRPSSASSRSIMPPEPPRRCSRHGGRPGRLRPDRPRRRGRHLLRSSSTATPRPEVPRHRRDQQRHLRIRPRAALRRAPRRSARTTRRVSTTCPISSTIYRARGLVVETVALDESDRDPRREQPAASWPWCRARLRERKNARTDGAGVTHRRSGGDVDRAGRRRRAGHGHPSPASTSRAARRSARVRAPVRTSGWSIQ